MWFKVDDGLAFHHKTVQAGNAAMGLWVRAGSWSGQHMTDGFVPARIVATMGTSAQACRLVAAGLWLETDGGYQFHGWGEWQPTRDDVISGREAEKKRKKIWRDAKKIQAQIPESPRSEPGVPRQMSQAGTWDTGSGRGSSTTDSVVEPSVSARQKTRSPRGGRIPPDFAQHVTQEMVEWKRQNCPHVDGKRETENFVDYWTAASGANATKRDWKAAWRTWMRNAASRTNGYIPAQPQLHAVPPSEEYRLRT